MPSIQSHGTRKNLSGKIEVRHASPNKWENVPLKSRATCPKRSALPHPTRCLSCYCDTSGARNHSNHRIKVGTSAMGRSLVTFLGVRKNVVVQQVVAISHTAQPSRRISQILSPCFSWLAWRNFSVETCHGSLRLPSASLQTLSFQPWQP